MKFNKGEQIRQYWQRWMKSLHNKLAQGSYEIFRIIPYAHKDCWRRPDKNKERHERHKNTK